jgi:hypothetical protein
LLGALPSVGWRLAPVPLVSWLLVGAYSTFMLFLMRLSTSHRTSLTKYLLTYVRNAKSRQQQQQPYSDQYIL